MRQLVLDSPYGETFRDDGSIQEPSTTVIAALVIGPVMGLFICLKFLAFARSGHRKAYQTFLLVFAIPLIIAGNLLLTYHSGGHVSEAPSPSLDEAPLFGLGNDHDPVVLPWYFTGISVNGLAFVAAILFCFAESLGRYLVIEIPGTERPEFQDRIAQLEDAYSGLSDSLAVVESVETQHEPSVDVEFAELKSRLGVTRKTIRKRQLQDELRSLGGVLLAVGLVIAAPGSATADSLGPVDYFIVASDAVDGAELKPHVDHLLLSGHPGSSVCIMSAPEFRHVGKITVPPGDARARIRNRFFVRDYPRFAKSMLKLRSTGAGKLHPYEVPSAIEMNVDSSSLRPIRVILLGSPCVGITNDTDLSFEERMPSHGFIGMRGTEFHGTNFPRNTKISWWLPKANFGVNALHRRAVLSFHRLQFDSQNGEVVRFSPSLELAFKFQGASLGPLPELRTEDAAMVDPKIDFEVFEEDQAAPTRVPVVKSSVSIAPIGSLRRRVEEAGGDTERLRGEAITLLVVYDSSGSMADTINTNNSTLLRIAKELPEISKSLEVGVYAFNSSQRQVFPVTQIQPTKRDGGESLRQLEQFLGALKASAGDRPTAHMLTQAMQKLGSVGVGKRQFLLLATDVVSGVENKAAEASHLGSQVAKWVREPGTTRRLIMLYDGTVEEDAEFFRNLTGYSPSHSFLTRTPDTLVTTVLDVAMPGSQHARVGE
ncbi:MAG: vWA domain-containing protein [Planctomycetota bacterium]